MDCFITNDGISGSVFNCTDKKIDIISGRQTKESKHLSQKQYINCNNNNSSKSHQPNCRRQCGPDKYVKIENITSQVERLCKRKLYERAHVVFLKTSLFFEARFA